MIYDVHRTQISSSCLPLKGKSSLLLAWINNLCNHPHRESGAESSLEISHDALCAWLCTTRTKEKKSGVPSTSSTTCMTFKCSCRSAILLLTTRRQCIFYANCIVSFWLRYALHVRADRYSWIPSESVSALVAISARLGKPVFIQCISLNQALMCLLNLLSKELFKHTKHTMVEHTALKDHRLPAYTSSFPQRRN